MNNAAHKLKRMVQVIRHDPDPSHFAGWRTVAFDRFRSGILRRYGIACEVLDNGLIAIIVDSELSPIATLDVDPVTNHYVLLPFKNQLNSPLLKEIVSAIEMFATEIAEGPMWQ